MDASQFTGFALIAAGAFLAGGMNAMAGGGSFFSFPALLAAGVPATTANASNSVALWPASVSSAWACRREIARHGKQAIVLMGVSLLGGIAGGLLLLATTNAAFVKLIPWLMLIATLLFAFSAQFSRLLPHIKHNIRLLQNTAHREERQSSAKTSTHPKECSSIGGAIFQLIIAIYGGFFGAGLGILTLAGLSIQGLQDMKEMIALKNIASAVNYTVAALTFMIAGAVSWPHTAVMLITATLGGHAGAIFARRLSASFLRSFIVTVGSALTLIYFYKTYFS